MSNAMQRKLAEAWNNSYKRKENHLFWPSGEVIKFVSRYLRKRIGIHDYIEIAGNPTNNRIADIGCGIGRHLVFGTELGFEMHGIDLSNYTTELAKEWLTESFTGMKGKLAATRVLTGSVCHLPWGNNYFAHVISECVLDSMPFDIAQQGVAEIARVLEADGYFYCSLISGQETGISDDFDGEVIVATEHEKDTVQSYFTPAKIQALLAPHFEILEYYLVTQFNPVTQQYHSRWHVVSQRK